LKPLPRHGLPIDRRSSTGRHPHLDAAALSGRLPQGLHEGGDAVREHGCRHLNDGDQGVHEEESQAGDDGHGLPPCQAGTLFGGDRGAVP
jgi:hypothetical protein